MKEKTKELPKKTKAERRRGLLANRNRTERTIVAVTLAIFSVSLAFVQLGFAGLGFSGEYVAYAILMLLPVALAALLLGILSGFLIGLCSGAALFIHASVMPLDFYELTFVTPLTSIVMLGVAGLLLGALFSFALRHRPSKTRTVIYIIIVCVVVSWLYSIGFITNAFFTLLTSLVANYTESMSEDQLTAYLQEKVFTMLWRVGDVGIQAWVDAALMSASCVAAYFMVLRANRRAQDIGLRGKFAMRMSIVVFVSFMVLSSVAFACFTQGEFSDASLDMEEELSYLWNQIDDADKRVDALFSYLGETSENATLDNEQLRQVVESSTLSSLLDGYSAQKDGIVLFLVPSVSSDSSENASGMKDYIVAASDDGRFPVGEKLYGISGESVVGAVNQSIETSRTERGIYDEDYAQMQEKVESAADRTIRSDIVFVRAQQKDGLAIAIMMPASKVFAVRTGVMGWTALLSFLLFTAVFTVMFILLDRIVVRRIDETNTVLARITAGDLDAEVTVCDSREFASLSAGVNETVGALKGWIAEAESRMDTELATAKAIQESALPRVFPPFPDIPKFDIFAAMNAAREVGGDFYDFFLIGDDCNAEEGKLGFVIADVSGKGVPAALFMMKAKTQIRDYLEANIELGEAVENANRQLCDGNEKGMFVTVWAGVLDYATGHIDYVNAGHNPPLLYKEEAGWTWLTEKSGLPLGLYDGLPYEAFSIDCVAGDKLLLYTDGVTEAMSVDDDLYGEDRLVELANRCLKLHPHMLVEATRDDVAAWAKGAEQSDDITMLALEIGVPPEITVTLEVRASSSELPRVNEFIHDELDKRLCPKRVQSQLDIAVEEIGRAHV